VLVQPRKSHLPSLKEQPEEVPRRRPKPPRDGPLIKEIQEPFGVLVQPRMSSLEKLVPILPNPIWKVRTQPARRPVE